MQSERLKIIGFDLFVDFINTIVVITSYFLTIGILKEFATDCIYKMINQEAFLQGAFVFIAPCAMEGMTILTSKAKKDKNQDGIEVTLSIISILVTLVIAEMLLFRYKKYVWLFEWIIFIYPLKIFSNMIYDFIHLIKARKK